MDDLGQRGWATSVRVATFNFFRMADTCVTAVVEYEPCGDVRSWWALRAGCACCAVDPEPGLHPVRVRLGPSKS